MRECLLFLMLGFLLIAIDARANCEEDSYDMQKLINGSLQGMDKRTIEGYIDSARDLPDERKARIHGLLDELYGFPDLESAMKAWKGRIVECKDI